MSHPPPNGGPAAALAAARQAQSDQWVAEAAQLEHVLEFTRHYRSVNSNTTLQPMVAGTELLIDFGGDGTPRVAEFCILELAAGLGIAEHAAFGLIADAVDLAYRHPGLWQLVRDVQLRVWTARELVKITRPLGKDAAVRVDAKLAEVAVGMSPARLFRFARAQVLKHSDPKQIDAEHATAMSNRGVWFDQSNVGLTRMAARLNASDAVFLDAQIERLAKILASAGDESPAQILRAKALGLLSNPARSLQLLQSAVRNEPALDLPDEQCPAAGQRGHTCGTIDVDPDKLLPRTQLIVHLTDTTLADRDGMARAEQIGPVLAGWVKDLTQSSRISVRPVLKIDALQPCDAYEVPDAMREAVMLRNPVSVFPYSSRPAHGLDLDHTQPYRHDGSPGQTRADNLGPLTRRAHRAKTHSDWQVAQPWPGTFAWTSPLGYGYLVTPSHSWLVHEPATASVTGSQERWSVGRRRACPR